MRNTCRRNRPSPEQETRPLPMLKLSGWCAIIAPTKARELCEKDTVRLPWQQAMDLKISLEPQGLFSLAAYNLHHFYTTRFEAIC